MKTAIEENMPADTSASLYTAFVKHDPAEAIAVIERAKSGGVSQEELFDTIFVPAMSMLGAAWAQGTIDEEAFAQASVVAEQITSFVVPSMAMRDTGMTILVGTMHRDEHTIGKNIIGAALKEAGHRVIDLGTSVRPAEFLERLDETGARIIIVFASLLSTAEDCARVRESLTVAGHEGVIVLVSGGPFGADEGLARRVGANGIVRSAEGALKMVAKIAEDISGGER